MCPSQHFDPSYFQGHEVSHTDTLPLNLPTPACLPACLPLNLPFHARTFRCACCNALLLQWHTADLRNNERYYGFARKEYEKAGRKIIEDTLDGKCQVFEKADYLDVLYRKP